MKHIPLIRAMIILFLEMVILHISHIGKSSLSKYLKLLDVLVVPHFTKNLISISKLTKDSLVDVLFSNPTKRNT